MLLISILVRLGITSLILCSSLHCSQLKENLAIWFTRDLWNHRSFTILYPGEPSMGYCWRARYTAQRTSGSLRCVYICRIKLSAFSVGVGLHRHQPESRGCYIWKFENPVTAVCGSFTCIRTRPLLCSLLVWAHERVPPFGFGESRFPKLRTLSVVESCSPEMVNWSMRYRCSYCWWCSTRVL